MSREPTDLVCRGRRRELGPDERWRLDDLLRTSPEARLVNTMLSEFERESQVQSGDDLLLARISARVLGAQAAPPALAPAPPAPAPAPAPRARRRVSAWVLAAAVFLVGSFAWAWRAGIVRTIVGDPAAPQPSAQPRTQPSPVRQRVQRQLAPAAPAPNVELPEPTVDFADEAAPAGEEVPKASSASPRAPSPAGAVGSARAKRPSASSELFARANLLRRQGRSSEAAALYRLILDDYATEREAAPARLALAKLLRAKDPARALAQFRLLAQRGGALRPEALWGIAESARSLGDRAVEEQALSDLLREFPDSPYADVARRRKLGF